MNRQSFEEHYDPRAFPGSLRLAGAIASVIVVSIVLFEAAAHAVLVA